MVGGRGGRHCICSDWWRQGHPLTNRVPGVRHRRFDTQWEARQFVAGLTGIPVDQVELIPLGVDLRRQAAHAGAAAGGRANEGQANQPEAEKGEEPEVAVGPEPDEQGWEPDESKEGAGQDQRSDDEPSTSEPEFEC